MKKLFTVLKISAIVLVLLAGAYFLFRQQIYNYILAKVQDKFHEKYHCNLIVGEIVPDGISGFGLRKIALVPEGKDTLLKVSDIDGVVRLSSLLRGKPRLSKLVLNNGKINAIGIKEKNNYSFLLSSKKDTVAVSSQKRDYAATVNKLLSALFASVPNLISIHNFDLTYTTEDASVHLAFPSIVYDHSDLAMEIVVLKEKIEQKWFVKGRIDKSKEHFQGKLFADKASVIIPYVDKRYQLNLAFDTLSFALTDNDYDDDHLILKGNGLAENLRVRHPKLDSNEVHIKHLASDYIIDFGKASIALQVPNLNINKIVMDMKMGYDKEQETKVMLEVDMKRMPSQDFFNSLPEGLFSTFEGIQTTGDLAYHFKFALNLDKPDSVVFDSKMSDFNFKVRKFGVTNFSKMNGSFVYTAYERGKPVKSFQVGPENPSFTPLDQISPYLQNAVLQSEDGSFFWHKGFREDAFRMAVSENVKKGRFARGGSTISMQLVKNVFLSRKKTIARKLEEALIVWLIERNRLTSKERMYEVYLNVIEWGPFIYGVTDAAEFYFNKKPADLTLEESIFMASIIPKPKAFKYSFDESGNLKPYLEPYFRKVADLMMRRGIINEEQRDEVSLEVKLRGPAKDMVIQDGAVEDDEEDAEDLFGDDEPAGKKFLFFNKNKQKEKEIAKTNQENSNNKESAKAQEAEKPKKKKWSLFK